MEVGGRIGTLSTCPSERELGSAMLFALTISSRVTPKRLAISHSVSPALTVYVTGATVTAAGAVCEGVATGVSISFTRSPLLATAPLHPAITIKSRAENVTLANRRGGMLNLGINLFNSVSIIVVRVQGLPKANLEPGTLNLFQPYGFLVIPVCGIVGRLPSGC